MKIFFLFFLISLSACTPKNPEQQANNASKTASSTKNTPPALEPENYEISTTDLGSGNVGASVAFNEPEEYASYIVTIDGNDTSSLNEPNEPNEPNTIAIVEGIYRLSYEVCGASVTFDCTELGNYTSISLSACNNEGCGPSVPQTLSCPNVEKTSDELSPISTILEADQEILALARSFKSEVTNLIDSGELPKDARTLLEPIVAKADCDIVADFDTILALITEEEELSTEAIIGIAVGVTAVALTGVIVSGVMIYKRARKEHTAFKEYQNIEALEEIERLKKKTRSVMSENTASDFNSEKKAPHTPLKELIAQRTLFLANNVNQAANIQAVSTQLTVTQGVPRRRGKPSPPKKSLLETKKDYIREFIKNLNSENLREFKILLGKNTTTLKNILQFLKPFSEENQNPKFDVFSNTSKIDNEALTKFTIEEIKSRTTLTTKPNKHKAITRAFTSAFLTQDGPSAFDNFKAYCIALLQEVAELKLLINIESIKLASGEEVE